jgi:hypothetical protein
VPRQVVRLITRLVVDYYTYAARPVASARRAACRVTHHRLLRLAQARRRLLRLRRASGCLGTSRGSSRGLSSTTSTTPCVRMPRHIARLIARLVAPLVVDYFAYAARLGASARRAARHAARCRLLHLRRPFGCFGTSRGLSRDSSSASRRLVVDYFAYAACPGASARRAARHAACRRLLRLRRASGCLGTSRGSSRDSSRRLSLTTSPTPHVRVPWHVTRLVMRLVVEYFAYAARPVASTRPAACRVTHRRLLRIAQARRRLLRLA